MTFQRWTPKSAVARSRQQLTAANERLRRVALEWQDVDQSFIDRAEQLIAQLEEFADEIRDQVQQRLDAGEHVGL